MKSKEKNPAQSGAITHGAFIGERTKQYTAQIQSCQGKNLSPQGRGHDTGSVDFQGRGVEGSRCDEGSRSRFFEVSSVPESVSVSCKRALFEAWTEFIRRRRWDWFVTLTFGDFKSYWSARRWLYRWLRKVNEARYGRSGRRKGFSVDWVFCSEYQVRGALHFHGLVADVEGLRRLDFMDIWFNDTGGFARIYPAQQDAGTRYCAKYVMKTAHEIEIDFWFSGLSKRQIREQLFSH